jgi:hypothetical protein
VILPGVEREPQQPAFSLLRRTFPRPGHAGAGRLMQDPGLRSEILVIGPTERGLKYGFPAIVLNARMAAGEESKCQPNA